MKSVALLKKCSSSLALSRRATAGALTRMLSYTSDYYSSSVSRNALQPCSVHNFATTTIAVRRSRRSSAVDQFEWLNVTRGFHLGRPLHAENAAIAADYSDDDNSSSAAAVDDEGLDISKLGISPAIVSSLAQRGITKLFPIQRAVLEPAMQGNDMIARARTGTGKTLAFGIPIMDKIVRFNDEHGKRRNPLALILAPTRELARQVDREFFESALAVKTACVYGGVSIQQQMSLLDRGVDVVVGTPGRVIDLIKRGALNLSEVQFVVLDEADQMLNVGFADAVETILGNIQQDHQTMMFSATMPDWILKLTHNFLKNPVNIDLVGDSDQKLAEGISLYAIASGIREKPAILGPLIAEHAKGGKVVVFTQTKRDADRLALGMQKNLGSEALHGDISQNQRERTLARFRDGLFNVLVATDVAARGLDVPNVDLVIHFELPRSSEIFVHRSGRTGRAGKKGSAIVIYSPEQYRNVKNIEHEVGCTFTELPRIAVDAEAINIFSDTGYGSSPFGSFGTGGGGRIANSGFGRSGGYGNSGGGRFSGYGGRSSGQKGGYGAGQSGCGFSRPSSGHLGNFGAWESGGSGGFGDLSNSNRYSGFGSFPGHSSGFGTMAGTDCSNVSESFGALRRPSGSGGMVSSGSSGFADILSVQDSCSTRLGGLGDDKIVSDKYTGREVL